VRLSASINRSVGKAKRAHHPDAQRIDCFGRHGAFRALANPAVLALMFAALALSPTSSALAAEPYEGRWAEDIAWCRNTRASGTDNVPITITRRAIETFASSCRVRSTIRKGTDWHLRTSCRDEGQSENEPRTDVTFVLRIDGDRLYLRDSDDTGVQTLTRCP
jgi:hypothetical protein